MKTITVITLLLFISFYSFAQQEKPNNMKLVLNGASVFKKGTVAGKDIDHSFYMSNEITNKEYREFIDALKATPQDSIGVFDVRKYRKAPGEKAPVKYYRYGEILKNVIDTSVWNGDARYKNYFSDERFDNYPVVGVTYTNARFYCLWKTQTENENRKEGPYLDYRLPTAAEWEYAAANALSTIETFPKISKVTSGKKNIHGLYHLNGNVAEWVTSTEENGEEAIRGSSWKAARPANEITPASSGFRDNATGFRMVMTYIHAK